ncbi:hypothetical protein [Agromyces humi]|uniref:hypothetical protein n=1 Tax=Agromyces humi TaxID=1766800 RepID=UPI001358E5D3|nr:hypothetical protein [Agromyces humi]
MDDGYPTSEDLERIHGFRGSPEQLVELISGLWRPEDFVTVTPGDDAVKVRFVTGGWSGNEELIGALDRTMLRLFWSKSERGGLHEYEIPVGIWGHEFDLRFPAPKCGHCGREI